MKKIKKKLTAIWEVLSMAEWLEGLDRNPTNDELVEWYKGDFFPMYLTGRASKYQKWNLHIVTTLEQDDGTQCKHEMQFKFDKPMSMHEVLNGATHIKIDRGGIKTRWLGVTKAWLKDLDDDFDNTWLTTKAEVTAECITELSASSVMGEKFARLIAGGIKA